MNIALDEGLGATGEPWPLVAQLARRASFDPLAAYTERAQLEPSGLSVAEAMDSDRLMADVEAALDRGKRAGRNRVVRVNGYSGGRVVGSR